MEEEDIKKEIEELAGEKEITDDYLDLTKPIEVVKEEPIEEKKVENPDPIEEIKEEVQEKVQEEIKEEVQEEVKEKSVEPKPIKNRQRKSNLILFVLFCLCVSSLGVSAYVIYDTHYLKNYLDNPEIIYSGDWDCFTERCVDYMTLNEWAKDNCNSDLTECKINYQGQEINLPFGQINLPPEHELLCKKYVCSTEIPIRRYSDGE